MAEVQTSPRPLHSPTNPTPKRPRGILKNSFIRSPTQSPTAASAPPDTIDAVATANTSSGDQLTEKELVIHNTQVNAGHRRSSSVASRPAASRRQSSRTPSSSSAAAGNGDADDSAIATDSEDLTAAQQRLKWDEANLYLTEQERTSTMKITEPKTPYAKQYDPSEDSDGSADEAGNRKSSSNGGDIPGLSLGEPEEEIPELGPLGSRKTSKVHVSDEDATPLHDAEKDEWQFLSPEEREKHRRFEELRKKHYEMSEAVGLLGHPEIVDEDEDDDEDDEVKKVPSVPKLPEGVNGS